MTERTKKRNDGCYIVEACNFRETSGEPRDKIPAGGIKILRDIGRLLTTATRRDATVSREPGTVERASIMMLSSIMLDCGLDDAKAFLDAMQSILWETLKEIADAMDPIAALYDAIARLGPESNQHVFSVHRTTVTSMIPHANRAQLDTQLMEQYKECMENLAEMGAKSDALIIAADETHEKVRSSYYNGNYSYVVVGQTSTWQRGFVYPTGYDATHQLFMGSRHRDYRLIDSEKNGVRPWLRDMTSKCTAARELGVDQVMIEGDRTYFNAELYARANRGMIDPGAPPGHWPRVIAPRKFTREKDDFKWEYLLDATKPQVFIDYIGLNPYNNLAVKREYENVYKKGENYHYQVPYACVAMVDEYSAREKRTLDEVRARARVVQVSIDRETNALEQSIKAFMATCKRAKGRKAKEPSFGRGSRRTKFACEKERRAYMACFKCYARLERWKKEKAALLKTLMFFAISLLPGDDPVSNPSMFIGFARDYHERWGIENGFRDVKDRFLSKGRSRHPCMRQFRLVLGMMLYNRWEVERKRVARMCLAQNFRSNPADSEARPWIRFKYEKECHHLPTAVGVLVDSWRESILSLVKIKSC
nr:hypothetical protein [Candidatus Sigynarchaeota archaeon]